ncbi:hypothetical protein IT568_06590 [bacterium]|nr:hypothetical protein [bacterium]
MKDKKTKLGGLILLISYLLLFSTLVTSNAVLLVVLIPLGIVLQIVGIVFWIVSVWQDASQKGLL